jgi:hypothetical protein
MYSTRQIKDPHGAYQSSSSSSSTSHYSSSSYHSSYPYTSSSPDTVAARANYSAAERTEIPKCPTMGDPGDRLRGPGDSDNNGGESEGDKAGDHRLSAKRHKTGL